MPVRSLFEDQLVGIGVSEADPLDVTGELLGAEKAAVAGAAESRVAQFTAGRVCAREALAEAGWFERVPIPRGTDRAPVWPPGFVGSITHTRAWCAAAAAPTSRLRAIGIDVEPATPLDMRLRLRTCTPSELAWLAKHPEPGLMAKVIFSAKESVYKCQYTLTGEFLGFQGASLELAEGRFVAVLQRGVGPLVDGYEIAGRYTIEAGLVATACAVEAR